MRAATGSSICRHARPFFCFQAEAGIRYGHVTGVQMCALPISLEGGPPDIARGSEFDSLAGVVHGESTFEGGRGGVGGTVAGLLVLFFASNLVNILGLNY